jgi:hypothetical protein
MAKTKISPQRIEEYERVRERERDERRYNNFVKEHKGAIYCSVLCFPLFYLLSCFFPKEKEE